MLLDGKHSFAQIDRGLSAKKENHNALLRKNFIDKYKSNPQHWLRRKFRQNSVYNWNPKTNLRLVHCQGDDQVPYTISKRTLQAMHAKGNREVKLITPDILKDEDKKLGHLGCFVTSMEYTAKWFIQMRESGRSK